MGRIFFGPRGKGKKLLLTLKDITQLAGYTTERVTYHMLRRANVHPVKKERRGDGQGQWVGMYEERDVLRALAWRLKKVRRQNQQ